MKLYRLITDVDSSTFCHRVSEATSGGWSLHGSPTMAFNAETGVMMCGQAVTKEVADEDYHRDIKLGAY